ncbi:MAG: CPBP family glutamic-type intramembrane protease [Turicibacter sp.]
MNYSFKNGINEIPVTNRRLMFSVIVTLAFLLYFFPIFKTPTLRLTQGILCNALLLIMALTLASKETKQYLNIGTGYSQIIFNSISIMIVSQFLQSLTIQFYSVSDPQNLSRFQYDFSPGYFTNQLIKYMFVGVGEELFKLFFFFVIYSLLTTLSKHKYKLFNCCICILITCLLFGVLHVNYNVSNWQVIVIAIALSASVNFYFLFKYQSIIPLMIAHAAKDMLVFITLMNTHGLEIRLHLRHLLIIIWLILGAKQLLKSHLRVK